MDETTDVTAEASYDPLENFDTSTPAEMLARQAEEVTSNTTDDAADTTDTTTEQPKEQAVEEEKKPYQPPQRIQIATKPFEMEIPRDEYGNIDPEKFGDYLQARDEHLKEAARAEAQNAYYENVYMQREWSDVGEAYPEIAKDDSLRTLAENLRVADALRGGDGSLMKAAEQIAGLRQSSVAEGKQQQQASITRQKSVTLSGSPRASNTNANKTANLRKAAAQGDDNARIQLLSSLYDSGALNA